MVKKTQDQSEDQNARLDRLCSLLEQLLSRKATADALVPVGTLPESERGSNPVVDDLRRLRPAIQASGDRKAIDAFNNAMTLAKRGVSAPAETLLAAYDRQPSGALSFEEMVTRRGRELRGELRPEPISELHRGEDHQPGAETYQQAVDRVRAKMLRERK